MNLNLTKDEMHYLRRLLECDFRGVPFPAGQKSDRLKKIIEKVESLDSGKAPDPGSSGFRRRELEWRRTHPNELKQYSGQWVVLEGGKIITHGDDPEALIEKAKAKKIQIPYIFFVEKRRTNGEVRIGI